MILIPQLFEHNWDNFEEQTGKLISEMRIVLNPRRFIN